MTQNFNSSRPFLIFYEFSVRAWYASNFVFNQLQLDSPSHFTSNLSPEAMENLKEELNNTKVQSRSLPKILHYLANNICQSLIKLWMLCRVALWTQMVEQRINSEV